MGWLRSMFQDVRTEHASRAVLSNPLTQFTGGPLPAVKPKPSGSSPHRREQPCGTTSVLARWSRFCSQHCLPTSLGSTIITRFFATTEALTPAGPSFIAHRGSLIHVIRTSHHSVSNHLRFSTRRVHFLCAGRTILFGLHLLLAGSPKPPTESSSHRPPMQADFVTDWWFTSSCSPPGDIAPMQLLSVTGLQCQPSQGLSPCCSNALSGALAQASLPVPLPPSSVSETLI